MKTLIISLLMFYSYLFLLGHQQEMHQHITRESFQLLKYSFPEEFAGLDEMENYLGFSETNNEQEDPVLFNSVGAFKLVAGSWFEDEYDMVYHYGTYRVPNYNDVPPWFEELIFSEDFNRAAHTTITHFWNADAGEDAVTHLQDTIIYGEFTLDWEFSINKNALKKIRKYTSGNYEARWIYSEPVDWQDYGSCLANDFEIPGLIELYHGYEPLQAVSCLLVGYQEWQDVTSPVFDFPDDLRKGLAYNLLGRMCHLLQDMSVPAHAHSTSHAGIYGMYSDIFESNELNYLQEQNWCAADVYDQLGGFIDPYLHEDPVYYLAYFLNQIADYYPDGLVPGDENYDTTLPGLAEVISGLDNQLQPQDLNVENCSEMFNVLIPYAIKATAGLLYWFAVESEQIEPVPDPWYVSGQALTSDQYDPTGITVHFDKLNSTNDLTINSDDTGFFSHQFYYRDSGVYDIEVNKEGYYPVIFTEVNITQELDLGEILLEPIESPEYVLVSQDENVAAFRHLQGAIEFLQKQQGGTIYVQPGEYTGPKNRNLSWLPSNISDPSQPCHIRITAFEPHSVVIDCENICSAFVFDDQDTGFNYTNEDKISGLIIQNAPQAIKILNGSPEISNNIIRNCTINSSSEDTHGAGLYCLSSALITGNRFQNNTGNWNGDDVATFTFGGGIYISNNDPEPAFISNNHILSCSAQEGGALYCTGSGPVEVTGNFISGNTLINGDGYNDDPGDCEGIICSNCQDLVLSNNTIVNNQRSSTNGGTALLINNSENINIRNNTVSNNDQLIGIKLINNTNCELLNNIVTENSYGVYCWSGSDPAIDFCNIWNNQIADLSGIEQVGQNCQNLDPCFIDIESENYDLEWSNYRMSPCIDRGSSQFLDMDGTPSDLGSNSTFWHDNHITELGNSGAGLRYRWVSFPVLDRTITEGATDPRQIMQPLVEEEIDLIEILSQTGDLTWNNSIWEGDIENFISSQGYMIRAIGDHQLSVPGYRLAEDTEIYLQAGTRNWVGFFQEDPQSISSALEPIWDVLISVASEDWLFVKDGAYPAARCSMIPGKMYILEVSEDRTFSFSQTEDPITVQERTITENFIYNETTEYTAFVIEELNDPDVAEIGLQMDGQCIGAATVGELPVELLAFLPEQSRGEGEISFSFYNDNRKFQKPLNVLYKAQNSAEFNKRVPPMEPGAMISVKFTENSVPEHEFGLNGNYPNPFNPRTIIDYSIAVKAEVELQIYNLKGQLIRSLLVGPKDPGTYQIYWDGKDDANNEVSSGLYLYRLRAGNSTETRKMILLK